MTVSAKRVHAALRADCPTVIRIEVQSVRGEPAMFERLSRLCADLAAEMRERKEGFRTKKLGTRQLGYEDGVYHQSEVR